MKELTGTATTKDWVQVTKGLTMRPKYGNTRCWSELCQREFASMAERRRGEDLRMMEMAGTITNLEYQPQWVLSAKPKVTYTADFRYCEAPGHLPLERIDYVVVEDVKGVMTDASRVRIAWLKQKYGIIVKVVPAKEVNR